MSDKSHLPPCWKCTLNQPAPWTVALLCQLRCQIIWVTFFCLLLARQRASELSKKRLLFLHLRRVRRRSAWWSWHLSHCTDSLYIQGCGSSPGTTCSIHSRAHLVAAEMPRYSTSAAHTMAKRNEACLRTDSGGMSRYTDQGWAMERQKVHKQGEYFGHVYMVKGPLCNTLSVSVSRNGVYSIINFLSLVYNSL